MRPSKAAKRALADPANRLFVSAFVAWEYTDLNRRWRFGTDLPLGPVLETLGARLLGYPAGAWTLADRLPDLHRDPVDRMLVAHAIHASLTLVTAEATIRSYPVRTIW